MDFQLKRTLHAPINGVAVSNAFTDFKVSGYQPTAYRPSTPSRIPSPRPQTPKSHEMSLPGGWIVQKFGGTSIGKFAVGIARDIVRAGLENNRIAVVCSARSTSTKTEGTTNRLLRAAHSAQSPTSATYHTIIDTIKNDHIAAATAVISSKSILTTLISDIEAECTTLLQVLQSAQHLGEVSATTEDKIISKGEALSCRFLAALLQDVGVKSVFVDLSEMLKPQNAGFHAETRLDEAFYQSVARTLGDVVRNAVSGSASSEDESRVVPVITGYFGRVPGGLLNSIGRGYTDLCAALVAVGLKAKELQVWKEVDGIFTADPRKIPTAVLLESVTPSEAAELTFYGSEVIHPFTMEQVIRAQIPIRIKNVKNPRNRGTMIFPESNPSTPPSLASRTISPTYPRSPSTPSRIPHIRHASSSILPPPTKSARPKRPTAVTVKHNIVILNVHSNKRTRAHGFLMRIFQVLDKYHLSVDLVSSSEVHVSMALHSDKAMLSETMPGTPTPNGVTTNNANRELRDLGSDELGVGADDGAMLDITSPDLLGAVRELQEFGTIDLVNNMAIVSLIGSQLRNMVGISGGMFKALGDNGVNIEMISQGASEINISCVIDEREADRALSVLHTNLFTHLEY